jgi:hypothetical protein
LHGNVIDPNASHSKDVRIAGDGWLVVQPA